MDDTAKGTHKNGADIEDQVQVVDQDQELEKRSKEEKEDYHGVEAIFSKGPNKESGESHVTLSKAGGTK